MRLGSMKGRISCRFRTEDGSAEAGRKYIHREIDLVFEDGMADMSVEVELIQDSRYRCVSGLHYIIINSAATDQPVTVRAWNGASGTCYQNVFGVSPANTGIAYIKP